MFSINNQYLVLKWLSPLSNKKLSRASKGCPKMLHWTPQAIDDLESIFQYISHDSHSTAKLFVQVRIWVTQNYREYTTVTDDLL